MLRETTERARSLTARLLGLLTFALFPLALISLYQTQAVVNEAEELSRTALLAETQRAVSVERELLNEALGAAQGLGAGVRETIDDKELCSDIFASFVEVHPQIIFAGFIPVSGVMECSSSGQTVDFSGTDNWNEAIAKPEVRVASNPKGAVTGRPVLIASHPIFGQNGLKGYVSISIPHATANMLLPATGAFGDFWLATFSADGTLLSTTGEIANVGLYMPADMTNVDLFEQVNQVFNSDSNGGDARKYAVIPIFDGKVHAVGSWPIENARTSVLNKNNSTPLAFPILMWLVGIAVAWLGLHNLVIRHIQDLRDAMRRFALGERNTPQLELANPPEELAQAQRAFNRMVTILSETEERREADLHDKTVLLREVHHRVKNNLQLIASITNMQMRQVKTPETKVVLAQLQRRVRGLATIHQGLYSTPDLTLVDARDLVQSMVGQMEQIGGRTTHSPRVHIDLDSAMLYPDQAVPLSMYLAEALNNAWKYSSASAGHRPDLTVSLKQQAEGGLEMIVANTQSGQAPDPDDVESDGLGTRLMSAFVAQLEGTSRVERTDSQYRLILNFKSLEFQANA